MFTNLVVDLFIAQIRLHPEARSTHRITHFHSIFIGFGRDRRDHDLQGRQPQRKMARMMFDQNAGEPLQRSEDRAVQHHRKVLLAIRADVKRAQSFRQVQIHLQGAALPVTSDGIAQHIFQFWTIERALARIQRIGITGSFHRSYQSRLRLIPDLI